LALSGLPLKSLLLATSAAVAMVGNKAIAADLPPVYKAPPAVTALPFSWTGFYFGAHIGAGWGDKDWDNVVASSGASFVGHLGSLSATSVLGGVQAGYNLQSGNWLFGIETAWSWTDLKGDFSSSVSFFPVLGSGVQFQASSKINWIGTVVGKVGITFDRLAWYAGGGAAWTKEKDHLLGIAVENFSGKQDLWEATDRRVGWTLLTGLEYAFAPHWSARVQYNFYDFGTKSVTLIRTLSPQFPLTPTFTMDAQLHIQALTAGINYRF